MDQRVLGWIGAFCCSRRGICGKFKEQIGRGGEGKAGAGVKCQAGERWGGKIKPKIEIYRKREVSERRGGKKERLGEAKG